MTAFPKEIEDYITDKVSHQTVNQTIIEANKMLRERFNKILDMNNPITKENILNGQYELGMDSDRTAYDYSGDPVNNNEE